MSTRIDAFAERDGNGLLSYSIVPPPPVIAGQCKGCGTPLAFESVYEGRVLYIDEDGHVNCATRGYSPHKL